MRVRARVSSHPNPARAGDASHRSTPTELVPTRRSSSSSSHRARAQPCARCAPFPTFHLESDSSSIQLRNSNPARV